MDRNDYRYGKSMDAPVKSDEEPDNVVEDLDGLDKMVEEVAEENEVVVDDAPTNYHDAFRPSVVEVVEVPDASVEVEEVVVGVDLADGPDVMVCTVPEMNVRKDPDIKSDILTTISDSDKLVVNDKIDGWFNITVDTPSGSVTGWARSKFLVVQNNG